MKKKKSKISFQILKSFCKSALLASVSLGVTSCQRIPQMCVYGNDLIQPIEYHTAREASIPCQPISSFVIHRPGYSLAYDARNRNPAWVLEHLTAESISGETERSLEFKEDEAIPQHLRATLADYNGSGLDRGHQAPAADHRSNRDAMEDTFYMTNMCPQCPQFNRGYWAKFEKHVRDLTKDHANIYVVTGPLYLPSIELDGKRYVKYQVIGSNDVAVPTHFFKVITLENLQGIQEIKAYILPNQKIPSSTPLDKFLTTVQKVEKSAGLIFIPN